MAAAALPLTLCALHRPVSATASANPGGTAPASTPAGASKTAPKPHGVTIAKVQCVPVVNCSANPHQVSTRGGCRCREAA